MKKYLVCRLGLDPRYNSDGHYDSCYSTKEEAMSIAADKAMNSGGQWGVFDCIYICQTPVTSISVSEYFAKDEKDET